MIYSPLAAPQASSIDVIGCHQGSDQSEVGKYGTFQRNNKRIGEAVYYIIEFAQIWGCFWKSRPQNIKSCLNYQHLVFFVFAREKIYWKHVFSSRWLTRTLWHPWKIHFLFACFRSHESWAKRFITFPVIYNQKINHFIQVLEIYLSFKNFI